MELDWIDGASMPLGMVVGGSLNGGLDVRLHPSAPGEEAKVGAFVSIQGSWQRFFGIITDLRLESADSRFAASAPAAGEAAADILAGASAYAMARVTVMLVTSASAPVPQPARSLPGHFSPVYQANVADVQAIFGSDDDHHISIGSPLDMEDTPVCMDLAELVKRSNGVFGKSGTGKSFLTRILLAGILQKRLATNLVFDMHNEYGWQGVSESGYAVKGLKQLFPSRVVVLTLDEPSSRRRGVSTDFAVKIGFNEIEPEDLAVLAPTLGITELGVQACHTLHRRTGDGWLLDFLALSSDGLKDRAGEMGESASTLEALHRRLRQLQRLEFMQDRSSPQDEAVRRILDYLKAGRHVVLEFGRHGDDLAAYLLVANLITRRIHAEYRRRTEDAAASGAPAPAPLAITIEEAHRFLGPQIAGQTIFGVIAREMRKYGVTLLVVDQRPSGIDDEVLSQIGTRIICQLDNERDVDAVLSGAPGARELKSVLSRLEAKQQALLFGHALPMPVVVRTREYGVDFYAAMAGDDGSLTLEERRRREGRDLFGKEE